jgi:restriction endonuclease Mrr
MPVPTYDEFIEPLLRYLAARTDGAAIADVYEALANEMKLTPDDRAELLPSRSQPLYKNRIGWLLRPVDPHYDNIDQVQRGRRRHAPRHLERKAARGNQTLRLVRRGL